MLGREKIKDYVLNIKGCLSDFFWNSQAHKETEL